MLIGIDASRTTVAQRTGTEAYSLHIIRHLIQLGAEHRFRLYFRDEPPPGLFAPALNVERVIIQQARIWTHLGLGPAARRDPPDVLFVPAHVVPFPNVGAVPVVVTTHDLGYRRFPQAHPLFQRLYLDWSTRHSSRIAARVIAVSYATASDLTAYYRVPNDKIRVIHSGVDESLRPVAELPQLVAIRDRYGIPGPYVLHVGSLHARKNPIRLVEAFRRVAEAIPDIRLVFVGRPGWGYAPLRNRVQALGLAERVLFCGYAPDSDMPALYSGARCLAFPSLYEGFGFPALEAMACGAPVACSNSSSLPEIVGDAALVFDPLDRVMIAETLIRVLSDEALHALMSQRGLERAKQFSWKTAARDTLVTLTEAATA